MKLFELDDDTYFSLTTEEKEQLGKNVLKEIRNNRDLILPEFIDTALIPVLNNEKQKAEEREDYMLCDAINYIIKAYENETRM